MGGRARKGILCLWFEGREVDVMDVWDGYVSENLGVSFWGLVVRPFIL